jgi:DNA-binding transcriptional ArsR family regulator
MNAFEVLADPVRRRILELLAAGPCASGDIVEVIHRQFGISQSGVSQHLKVLREAGFAGVTVDGARRIYALETAPIEEIDAWVGRFREFWVSKLDALETEIARGKRARRKAAHGDDSAGGASSAARKRRTPDARKSTSG